jgi:hypothetical protein
MSGKKYKLTSYTPWKALGGRGGKPLSLTSVLEGGALYPPGKEAPVPIVQEAGWAPQAVWRREGIEPRSVATKSTDRATRLTLATVTKRQHRAVKQP